MESKYISFYDTSASLLKQIQKTEKEAWFDLFLFYVPLDQHWKKSVLNIIFIRKSLNYLCT